MVRFFKIPTIVEAIQVVYKNCCEIVELAKNHPNELTAEVDSDGIVTSVIVKSGKSYVRASVTDWIVLEEGNFFIVSDEEFTKSYEIYPTPETEVEDVVDKV